MQKLLSNKVVYLTLLICVFMGLFSNKAYAHKAYFLQVLIDENNMTYVGNVVQDNAKGIKAEESHIGAKLYGSFDDKAQLFTFPPKEVGGSLFSNKADNDISGPEIDRAFLVKDTLVHNLNEALGILREVGPDKFKDKPKDLNDLKARVDYIFSNYSKDNGSKIVIAGYEFDAKVSKGYTTDNQISRGFDYSGVADEISIMDLVEQAHFAASEGYFASNAQDISEPGLLSQKLGELLTDLANGLRNLLGLYSINDLVYNEGIRGSRAFHYGALSQEWMNNATAFHLIFQAMAWTVMTIAILKMLIQRNIATINVSFRINLIEGIKDVLMTAFLLASIYLIINSLLIVNEKIVGIFSTTTEGSDVLSGVISDYTSAAGGLLQLFYLFIAIYLNAVYIVRALTIAVLIGSAPFFIVSIAFESKNKKLFSGWIKELMSNIFIQSFHAFVFSIFISSQTSARGIESAIMLLALIPLTNMFKSLITGNSGGLMDNIGSAGMKRAGAATTAVAGGIVGGLVGARRNDSMARGSGGGSHDDTPGVRENPQRRDHSAQAPDKTTSNDAINSRTADYSMDGKDLKDDSVSETMSSKINRGGEFDTKGGLIDSGLNLAKGAGRVAKGVAGIGAGVGASLITGSDGLGSKLTQKGFSDVAGGAKSAFGGAVGLATGGFDAMTMKKDKGGNILGVETLPSGDTAVHRDREMIRNAGVSDIRMGDNGVAKYTYDMNKVSESDKANLNSIKAMHESGNESYLRKKGIVGVGVDGNNNLAISYNKHGQEALGYKDIYQHKNKIVETKDANHSLKTNLTYDMTKISDASPEFGSKESYNKQRPINIDNKM